MKTFSLSKVLYKQHMCDIFEVLWCFYCKYERTQNIDICFFKAPWIYFPKTVKYLDRFTSIMKINKPFKRIGQGQTDIRFPASSEGYQTYLEWEDSSPNLIQRPLAYFYILGWHFLIPFISYLKSSENHCQICLHLRTTHLVIKLARCIFFWSLSSCGRRQTGSTSIIQMLWPLQ